MPAKPITPIACKSGRASLRFAPRDVRFHPRPVPGPIGAHPHGADVVRFTRLVVGEGIEKVVEDYAAEVAKAMQV